MAEAVRSLGEAVSRKPVAASLSAIVEVKVETALVGPTRGSNGYLIALICVIAIVAAGGALATVVYCKSIRRDAVASTASLRESCSRHHDDEKSNNLQNEENLRRYTNPIRDESLSGSIASLGSIRHAKASLKPAASASDLVRNQQIEKNK